MPHVAWREELALLDVDRTAGRGRGDEQVGLPREKRGNLQDVRDFGGGCGLRGLVNVGQDRQPGPLAHLGKDGKSFCQSRSAEGRDRRAVGLVERGLEDHRHAGPPADLAKREGQIERMRPALNDAGTQDEREGTVAEGQRAHTDELHGRHYTGLAGVAGT